MCPTCAVLPQVLKTGQGVASLGCIGNRVYTGLADDELYFALPGSQVQAVTEKLATIVHANRELEKYHTAKLSAVRWGVAERIVWASDYPHLDATFPGVVRELEEGLAPLPAAAQAQIRGDNAARLYGLTL